MSGPRSGNWEEGAFEPGSTDRRAVDIGAARSTTAMRPRAIHVVYAEWCPHCVPTTVAPLRARARELGIPCLLHDIDSADVGVADDLVRKHGDWSDDYLVPQVFLEYDGGRIEHALTGNPRGLSLTRDAVEALLQSEQLAVEGRASADSK